jgi:hypothetical protein
LALPARLIIKHRGDWWVASGEISDLDLTLMRVMASQLALIPERSDSP